MPDARPGDTGSPLWEGPSWEPVTAVGMRINITEHNITKQNKTTTTTTTITITFIITTYEVMTRGGEREREREIRQA
jgi:hypothetical protein